MPTILILGATSDIGQSIAKRFAKEKYAIQLAGRNEELMKTMQSDIQIRFNVDCSVHNFDALLYETHQQFYDQLPFKPDVAVSVVGYMNDNEVVINNPVEMLKTVGSNYTGPISILNIVAKDYSEKKQGTIIGISSVAGNRGRQSNYIYGSAKAGFTAYLSGLRNKLYHSQVHVLSVLPGFVYTKMTEHLNLPKLLTAQPDQVANAIFKGYKNKKNKIYVKWFWRWIMLIITSIPEFIFKKKKL